jgi:hypothetical protein
MKAQSNAQGLPLNLLPSATEPLIYGSIDENDRSSLLQTSRWGRDAVLREARSVSLSLLPSDAAAGANLKPLARLLARACEAAEAGQLSLSLDAFQCDRVNGSMKSNVLADLLAPAKQQGGWASVKELELKVADPWSVILRRSLDQVLLVCHLQDLPEHSTPVLKLVVSAFPALQSLKLEGMPVSRTDLGSLSACSQLVCLDLQSCELQQSEAESITTLPLSALHSLRQLSVSSMYSSLAAGLTQLTGLSLVGGHGILDECLGHVSGLTQLQHLELRTAETAIPAAALQPVLTSLQQLTSLALHYTIRQAAFDALLTHAPHLTSFHLPCPALGGGQVGLSVQLERAGHEVPGV